VKKPVEFKTNCSELAKSIAAFEQNLPGWWWSVGQCSVGAHASCGVDQFGVNGHLLQHIEKGHPYDEGFHCDTNKGAPHEALLDVMRQAMEFQQTSPLASPGAQESTQ